MKTFPLEFAPEQPKLPLWRPGVGSKYFVPQTSTVQIWTGDVIDEERYRAGQVYRLAHEAEHTKLWLTALGKLKAYASVFNSDDSPHLYRIGHYRGGLAVLANPSYSLLPSFENKESAQLALESLTKDECIALLRDENGTSNLYFDY